MDKAIIDKLVGDGCRLHHSSYARGYVSRKTSGYLVPYKGRFGKGYKYFAPNWGSTQYCFVHYYVK